MAEVIYIKTHRGWQLSKHESSCKYSSDELCLKCGKATYSKFLGNGYKFCGCLHCKHVSFYRASDWKSLYGGHNKWLTEAEWNARQNSIVKKSNSRKDKIMKLWPILLFASVGLFLLTRFNLVPVQIEWILWFWSMATLYYVIRGAYWLFVAGGVGVVYLIGKKLFK